jgi:hypothetical protein
VQWASWYTTSLTSLTEAQACLQSLSQAWYLSAPDKCVLFLSITVFNTVVKADSYSRAVFSTRISDHKRYNYIETHVA